MQEARAETPEPVEPSIDYDADLGLPLLADEEGRTLGVAPQAARPAATPRPLNWQLVSGIIQLGAMAKGKCVKIEWNHYSGRFKVALWRTIDSVPMVMCDAEREFLTEALEVGEQLWRDGR